MLRELRIKNFAIIDDVSVRFDKGLNVLTGETGAGKSIIIDALCLALGARASSDLIRSGEKETVVEAFFEISPERLSASSSRSLEDTGIEADEGIIMKRIITAQGKNRAYINGSMVNVQTLSDVSSGIIDIHGQYEHQSLLSSESQLDMLDAYGGFLQEKKEIAALYELQSELRQRIAGLVEKERERTQRIDVLRYQIKEIAAADLKTGEESELLKESAVLSNAARLSELANQAYESLYASEKSCLTGLRGILNSLKEISHIDARAGDALKTAGEALPLLEETSYFLRDYKESLNFSPERLDEIMERIELIKGLKRKYGEDIQAILDYKESAARELDELQHSEERLDELKSKLEETKKYFTEKAQALSKKRKTAGKKIEQQAISSLSHLSMPDIKFSINISQEKGDDTAGGFKANAKGMDKVEYLISPNVGEELKPLSKIASGGELSRVMLALKETLAKCDRIPTLIFDEIDAGIGGRVADAVGKKLKGLSSNHQTICITHLPQIASYADIHLKIEKKVRDKRTTVVINNLGTDERAQEIARMLSGDGSEVSLKHAREMLKKVKN